MIDLYESAMEWICGKDGFFIVLFIAIVMGLFLMAQDIDMLQNAADGNMTPNQSQRFVDIVSEDFTQ